ncbi:MAG: aminoglycoside phosphotransferase family protein [Acetobacteraceae bacterium]|nr:aminoglycoside phosphotransferase family protein [Acetobacteraceae bacterium]
MPCVCCAPTPTAARSSSNAWHPARRSPSSAWQGATTRRRWRWPRCRSPCVGRRPRARCSPTRRAGGAPSPPAATRCSRRACAIRHSGCGAISSPRRRRPALLHGDLQHGNILADGPSWRAIDPIGATGDPLFDPASALCEPVSFLSRLDHFARLLDRRLGLLAERLAADRARLAAWAFAITVLKVVWAIEDGRDERGYAAIAAVLSARVS